MVESKLPPEILAIDRAFKKSTPEWYTEMFKTFKITPECDNLVSISSMMVSHNYQPYNYVGLITGVPWWAIGCFHFQEGDCDLNRVLHNGENIIGTGRKTTNVPAGRGPFNTFVDSAVDAIRLKGLDKMDWSNIGQSLKNIEPYNGTGYIKYHPDENDPYIWACSNANDGFGKYTFDHGFDPNAPTNKHPGIATILKKMEQDKYIFPIYSATVTG